MAQWRQRDLQDQSVGMQISFSKRKSIVCACTRNIGKAKMVDVRTGKGGKDIFSRFRYQNVRKSW